MKIIKTGSIPEEKYYMNAYKCNHCLTTFEVDDTEFKREIRQVYVGELVEEIKQAYVECPLCDRRVYKYVTFTRKKIKCEENEENEQNI